MLGAEGEREKKTEREKGREMENRKAKRLGRQKVKVNHIPRRNTGTDNQEEWQG